MSAKPPSEAAAVDGAARGDRGSPSDAADPGRSPAAPRRGPVAPQGARRGARRDAVARPAWVEIDLDALDANFASLRERVAPARVLAVIKADAYGHGGRVVGRALEQAGADWLGVALLEEGIELRRAGVGLPILVLGPGRARQLPLFQRYRLTPSISSLEQLAEWGAAIGADGPRQELHLKVDTGMTRLGLSPGELPVALERIRRHPGLRMTGFLSHLADADEPGSRRPGEQERAFGELLAQLDADERESVLVHLANSAGALHRPGSRHALVRLGLSLLGYDPAGVESGLEPVMSVVSRVVQVRDVPAGTRVGYGGRWRAERPSRIAVVPVGYADGYAWRLGNGAEVLIAGRRARVVGSVTMDMLMLDVTGLDGVGRDSRVVLLGRDGDERITAVDLAERAGTIPYEVLCLLGLRLPRRYRRGGREIAFDSRFVAEWP